MSGVGKYASRFSRGKTHYWKNYINSVLIYLHFMHPCIWIDETLDAIHRKIKIYNYTILKIIKYLQLYITDEKKSLIYHSSIIKLFLTYDVTDVYMQR